MLKVPTWKTCKKKKPQKKETYHHPLKKPHHPQRKQVIGWLEVTGQIWQFWHSIPFSAEEPFSLLLHRSSRDGCNSNTALLLVLLTFSQKNLMVKSPTENSVPVLKGVASIELKIGDLPIVFCRLISKAFLPGRPLISHSFNQGAQNFCCLHVNTKPMHPSSDTLQFQFGIFIALCCCFYLAYPRMQTWRNFWKELVLYKVWPGRKYHPEVDDMSLLLLHKITTPLCVIFPCIFPLIQDIPQ